MTDEHKTAGPGDQDVLVSETYREIARERTPEHLDKAVLDAATRGGQPRYSKFIAWTRPTAWAATIVLSVALVLELTQTPALQPSKMDAPVSSTIAEPALEDRADAPLRQRDEFTDEAKTERAVQELKVKDADFLQRAEEMARLQEGQNDQPAQTIPDAEERVAAPAAAFAVSNKSSLQSAAKLATDASYCDAEATAEAESWLACIIELEEAGLTDIAREQRQLLAETFPDFEPR